MIIKLEALINHLKQISYLFSKDKEPWKSRAFSKVATELESNPRIYTSIEFENGRLKTKIPGVGKAIKDVIEQFALTGTSAKLDKLKSKLPEEVIDRFDARICRLKVTQLLKPLTENGVDWGFAGSMRRNSSTVRDVDVVVCLNNEEKERKLINEILNNADLSADVRNGQEKIGINVPIKSQGRKFTLDLNFTIPAERGAMYLYFTGSKTFNIMQRGIAKNKGMRLNQKGLFYNNQCIASKTEQDIFNALEMKYIEPNER